MTGPELANVNLRALVAEIDEAVARLDQLACELQSVDVAAGAEPDRATKALIAVDLHSYYTMLENLVERIIVDLEGRAPRGPDSHLALLRHAMRALEGIRPAIFDPACLDSLDELRRFRHFFRHAYALDLSFTKMRRALDPFGALHSAVGQGLREFAAFLRAMIGEIVVD